MAQKKALEDDAAATQRRMDSANALLSALAGEEGRWTKQSHEFNDTIQRLTGNAPFHGEMFLLMFCAFPGSPGGVRPSQYREPRGL